MSRCIFGKCECSARKGAAVNRTHRPRRRRKAGFVSLEGNSVRFLGISPRLSGYSQVGRFPSVWTHSATLSRRAPESSRGSAPVHCVRLEDAPHTRARARAYSFTLTHCLLLSLQKAHRFHPEALFTRHRSACFDKAAWIISLKNYHLSPAQDKEAASGGYFLPCGRQVLDLQPFTRLAAEQTEFASMHS